MSVISQFAMQESSSSGPANKLQTIKKALHDFLHQKGPLTPAMEMAEKYTKLKREYLFLGEATLLLVLIVSNKQLGASTLNNCTVALPNVDTFPG